MSSSDQHHGSTADSSRGASGRARFKLAVAVAVVTLGVTAGSIAAASSSDTPPAPDTAVVDASETVLARGSSAIAGRWQLTAYESRASAGQPAGLPCVRLELTDPQDVSPHTGSGFCGEMSGDFGASSMPIANGDGSVATLVFGRVPSGTQAVALTSHDESIRASTYDGQPSALKGDAFVMEVPASTTEGSLIPQGASGRIGTKTIDVTSLVDRLGWMKKLADTARD